MLDFRAPQITDRQWVMQLIDSTRRESCEYCFGNIFIWSPIYDTYIARFEDFFLTAGMGQYDEYCFPMGHGDLRKAIEALRADARERGRNLRFFGVTESDKLALESVCPGEFLYEEDRDFFDYIYDRNDLATLAGKKYHAKRNHIAAFERNESYTYEEICNANIDECIQMNARWNAMNLDKNPTELEHELQAIMRSFENYEALGFRGALLRVDGEVVAFTMGEAMGSHMFCTHFEKAFAHVRGAYPMINREFAARSLTEYPLINREEDTGDDGLRKAKLSYHPLKLLVKYNATSKV